MEEQKSLVLKFEPSTIEHLGVKMYSHIPPALAELVANSYDACAKNVYINLFNSPDKKIVIIDDGSGMTFDEVNNYFLRIGRNRRKENQDSLCGRKPTGKKGLGKLALFGLGNVVEIETVKDNIKVTFTLNYNDILSSSNAEYSPEFNVIETKEETGTKITLKELKHQSNFSETQYANSLARLFNFHSNDFSLYINLDDGDYLQVDNKLKFENLTAEFEWSTEAINSLITNDYENKSKIKGKIITTEKPIKPALRGVTLFANGRLVNTPEFFGKSESSHFFSYITGYLDVDFVDEWEEDVIATNRQSIDWELAKSIKLKEHLVAILTAIEKDWRKKREEKRESKIEESTGININQWKSTLPTYINSQIETILQKVKTSELESVEQSNFVKAVYNIAPEYPLLHWRHLHPEIQDAAKADYQKEDYYRAFIEAVKRYINKVRLKSKENGGTDQSLMGSVFGLGKILQVTANFNKPDGSKFHADTYKCIEEGQKLLSMGIVSGARNPISHEEIVDLRESGLFSEKDCLDMLSLLSHLFKRLEDANDAP
ncbi:MAG: TIGR02391 family protein [Roseivirga sp.]|uniref:TIGR02391 family protein n=1 Tax=Roseivirga sp. TaxID=1964215 RepID=UPI001B2198A5|nr:TIGR02391 family protein [Roseivirga sp.]MBO6659998.1 TIGR02391 family protein [Roseivirga sp.]MBO6760632.1 TIGR02391 family protein [Roseivirga sp.]MBO6907265.1 TIGR02391 family protein [Roseivirga sp.]